MFCSLISKNQLSRPVLLQCSTLNTRDDDSYGINVETLQCIKQEQEEEREDEYMNVKVAFADYIR